MENKDKGAPHNSFKDYALGFVHADIKYLPQIPDEQARRYLFVAIDRATHWIYVRIYSGQTGARSCDFVRLLHRAEPMKTNRILTENGNQFTDRSTSKNKKPSGKYAFDRECERLGMVHRLIKPRHPQTNSMVACFNGRISDVLATTQFDSQQDLATTIKRYVKLYNEYLPQRALSHKTPLQALRQWHKDHPEQFVERSSNQTGLDTYPAAPKTYEGDSSCGLPPPSQNHLNHLYQSVHPGLNGARKFISMGINDPH